MHILVVEDNAGDARLMIEAFRQSPVPTQVSVVTDGEQALAFLRREGEYAGVVPPDVVLLDLYLPKKNGLEVLSELKADVRLQAIPVAIVSSPLSKVDQQQIVDLGAERVMRKPLDLEEYFALMQEITQWWNARKNTAE
jgi:CheY-like chemotaxis protein